MKSFISLFVILLCMVFTTRAQNNVGINDNNSSPNASAMLDVYSTSKGLLIPRISLLSSTDVTTISSPASSLLVFNTSTISDVSPGYYYWNGSSNWVRLITGTDPKISVIPVAKSADATLLVTENLVFASGDITLTLPTVTSADDGLEITIKNVGTYTDLISVVPESGKTIDATTMSKLTRWRGRTYIASGSNWIIKEKEARTDNLLDVCSSGSFKTIAEVVAFLNVHMSGPTVVRISCGTFPVAATLTINLPYPVTFEGLSFGETTIDAAAGVSGSPLFTCVTECYFKMLIFNAISNSAGNDAIRFTGSGTYNEVKDCVFYGFNKGIVTTSTTDLWIFENDFEDCAGAGIEIAAGSASGGRLRISETDFVQCAKGINLLSGISEAISIVNCAFYNTISGTDIGISYNPADFTAFESMLITNNGWNNQGTYMSGFDFTRSDGRDADAFLISNAGMGDKNPHCKINVTDNTSTTPITANGTYYKANWANGATSSTCKWTLANNRITYQPKNGRGIWSIITGNLSVNNANRVITVALVKNGVSTTRYGETTLRVTVSNQPFQFSTVIYVSDIKKNDYLELWVTSASNGDVVTFQDIQWYTDTK